MGTWESASEIVVQGNYINNVITTDSTGISLVPNAAPVGPRTDREWLDAEIDAVCGAAT